MRFENLLIRVPPHKTVENLTCQGHETACFVFSPFIGSLEWQKIMWMSFHNCPIGFYSLFNKKVGTRPSIIGLVQGVSPRVLLRQVTSSSSVNLR